MKNVSTMKRTKQSRSATEGFNTHKDQRDYGFKSSRKAKRNDKYAAWA